MKRMGVGAAIILGARESRVHGEGRQGIDIPRVENNRQMLVNSGRTRKGEATKRNGMTTLVVTPEAEGQSLESRVR
jgi:hypothetical protein